MTQEEKQKISNQILNKEKLKMVKFFEFDPKTNHRCDRCANHQRVRVLFLTYVRCRLNKEMNLNEDYNAMRRNDCENWRPITEGGEK